MEYQFDADGTFRLPTLVRFSQCDATGALSLCELLRLASDAGVEDYRLRGLPRETLEENGYAILVSRTSFRLHRLPAEGEQVTLATMEEAPEPLLLVRSYSLEAENGDVLAVGVGKWIVVDIASRRIIPTSRFDMRRPSAVKKEHDCLAAGKIAKIDRMVEMNKHRIEWSDTDANGHTNNSRYAEFVMNAVGEHLGRKERITDFRINFNQEATLGNTLTVYMARDGQRIYVEGRMEKEGERAITSFEAEVIVAK